MALSQDKKQLVIDLDAKQAINQIGYLRQEYNKLSEARKATKSYTVEKDLSARMSELTEKIKEAREEVGLQGLSLKELGRYQRELKRELDQFPDQSDQWKEVNAELVKVAERYKEVSSRATYRAEQERIARDEMLETIRVYGTQALSVEQLDRLQRTLYRDIYQGAESGNVANNELSESFREVSVAVADSKNKMSRFTIAQEMEEKAVLDAVKANGIKGVSLKELTAYHKLLTKQITESSDFESAANKKRIKDAQEVGQLVELRQNRVNGTGGMLNFLKSSMPAALAGGIAGAAVGIVDNLMTTIREKFAETIAFIKERGRDISEIQTILQVDRNKALDIFADLANIDTERSRKELKELVLVAGDINVATKDVQDFVTQADKLERVFGRDFGAIGEASTMVAKLKDTFEETRGLEIAESYSKIGSAIKVLNDEGPASTKGITEFIARIGQLPNAVKPGIAETAALAAVMEEANLTAEISSGGISAVLLRAGKNAEEFGQFFKMSKDEFQQFVAEDPIGFLTAFAEKVGNYDEAKLSELFAGLKIESQESIKAIGVLSNNLDKFREKQTIANKAFNDGNRIDEIFRVFNNDENAQISKAEKKIAVFTDQVSRFFGKMGTAVMAGFADLLPDTISKVEQLNAAFTAQKTKADNLEKSAGNLLGRYEQLTAKQTKSKEESEELKTVMNQIADLIPGAVTKWDAYGNAIAISTGKVRENIIEQRKLTRELDKQRLDAVKDSMESTEDEIADKLRFIAVLERRLNDAGINKDNSQKGVKNIKKLRDEVKSLQGDLVAGKRQLVDLVNAKGDFSLPSIDEPILTTTTTPTVTPTDASPKGKKSGSGISKIEQLKQDRVKLAALVFEKNQLLQDGLVKEENALLRSKELADEAIQRDIKNVSEKKLALEANQDIYDLELKALREKYAKEGEVSVAEQAKISIQLAQQNELAKAQAKLQEAERSGDELRIYNAKFSLIQRERANALATEKADYVDQRAKLKDNDAAIEILKKNHKQRLRAIEFEHNQQQSALLADGVTAVTEAAKKRNEAELAAAVDKANNDVAAAQGGLIGSPAFAERLKLLDAQMIAELANTDLTESQKTEIVRKYALQRAAIEQEQMKVIGQQALQLFNAAYSAISNGKKANLQAEQEQEQSNFQNTIERLEKQKEAGIITDEQYQQKRKASEAGYNKEVKRLRYEQAKIDKQNNITQAIMNGIQAIMKTYSTVGFPAGIPLAIGMGAVSAYNVAQIANQKLPEYYYGGDTGNDFGSVDKRGGKMAVVHPREYIVSAAMRQTPQFAAIEPMLESIRTGVGSGKSGGDTSNQLNVAVMMRVSDTLNTMDSTMKNLTVAWTINDWERFHTTYNDFRKQNDNSLISNE
jgi:hypothetical protein